MRSLLLVLLMSTAAAAETPAGGEFRVNTYTTGNQTGPAVGAARDGSFVVVWQDYGRGGNLFGQRFDRAATPLGADFQVNMVAGPLAPVVAVRPLDDAFLVVWLRIVGTPATAVYAQLFDASGGRMGAEFQVSETGGGLQFEHAVAADGNGGFVVAWMRQAGGSQSIIARQVAASGGTGGSEIRVNGYTTTIPIGASVAADAAGNFVVVWSDSPPEDPSRGILAQRFDAGGARQGEAFLVNSATAGGQFSGHVAMRPDGEFVVAFASGSGGGTTDLFARRFTASGQPIGGDLQVNTYAVNAYTTENFVSPAIAMDGEGNFVVSWRANSTDGDGPGVAARRLRSDGVPRGAELVVNTYTTGTQQPGDRGSLGVDEVGNFVVAWRGPAPPLPDIYAQRYGGLHPAALEADTAGNRVWEPGETVDVRPSWFNTNGAAQTVGGILSGITGPTGATYAIGDGTATYGTIPDGAAGSCEDCYLVSVDDPPVRPALHWDASAVETLTPDTQGQAMRWRLHIGDSFADVPRASGFYRFVETVLHRSITGGCSANAYCPADSTTREQMAVFVLVAKEGPGYLPPACTTPVFADVPASSPFCRWIEELARRGVTGGCGGGNYCPTQPVSREQMAVFVLRTLEPTSTPPACAPPNLFNDVPETSTFCPWIEELARRGVVAGCGGGNYCPAAPVTREQMAVFLTGTFGLTLYGA